MTTWTVRPTTQRSEAPAPIGDAPCTRPQPTRSIASGLAWLVLCACGGAEGMAGSGQIGGAAEAFYAPDNFPEVELTLSDAARSQLNQNPETYQPGTLRVGTIVLEQVGIRLKGSASFRDLSGKAAFKIKVDEFVPGQRIFGLRRLTLNNLVQDASGVHERLGYRFMRAASVWAPRCNSARVSVNGEYWGLYANVETLDDEFVEARFQPAPGNLYDPMDYETDLRPGAESSFELETNQEPRNTSDLTALIAAVNGPDGSFTADAATRLDLDAVLRAGATQALIGDWDGYFGAHNNYELYHELGSDRFLLFPWGIDQSFDDPQYDIYGSTSDRENGLLFIRCKQEAACLARYQAAVADALAVFRSLPLEAELDAMLEQISDAFDQDPRMEWDRRDLDMEIEHTREFIRTRADHVQAQLDDPSPNLPRP